MNGTGRLDLKTAQQAIASNWIEAYEKYVSPNPPFRSRSAYIHRNCDRFDAAGQVSGRRTVCVDLRA